MADQAPRGEAPLAMKFSNMINEEAGSAHDGAGGSATDEPLFGDARWIEERLKALRNPDETGMRQEAD
jgi:hypothetical protein